MTDRGAGCWESRLSGSERGWSATLDMDEILWHRRETRRQTENTNIILCRGESPAYSKPESAWSVRRRLLMGDEQGVGLVARARRAALVPRKP